MAKGGRLIMDAAVVTGDQDINEIVYCYRFAARRDRIKIGYSSRGLKRILEQSTGFPENPEVLFVIHHRDAARIEKDFHAALAHKQAPVLGAEWFNAKMDDVFKVSPLLRRAARREKWRSFPRIFMSGAMFGMGVFMIPVFAVSALEMTGLGARIQGGQIILDYLASPFDREIKTSDIGRLVVDYMNLSDMSVWIKTMIYASPAAWAGLAYLNFKKQVV